MTEPTMPEPARQDDMKIEAYGEVILPTDPRHPRYAEFAKEANG